MTEVSIRPARLSDLDAILSLERIAFATDRLSRRSLRAFIVRPERPLIVAIADKTLAGYALIVQRRRAAAARLYSIAVDPRFAGRGAGRALMSACEAYALRNGRRFLRLEVRADNGRAIILYERLGYRMFGQYDNYYADGARALRFEKPLGAAAQAAQAAAAK